MESNERVFYKKWYSALKAKHHRKDKDLFWARDRSGNQKTILVINWDGPAFDKGTIYRMTYHYLKLFSAMGLHVIYAGDGLRRLEPYASVLEQLGIQVLYRPRHEGGLKQWIEEHAKYIDYAYLIYPTIAEQFIHVLKKRTKAKMIYNASDLIYLREQTNYELTGEPELLKSSKHWKKREFKLFKQADVIHVVSAYEQELLRKALPNQKVRHIPVCIYDDLNRRVENASFEEREGILFVGTFKHKPNIDGVLWFVHSILPKIVQRAPNIKLHAVGLEPPDEILNLSSAHVFVPGYVTDQELEAYYHKCRLVVAPLRFGAGVKGKVVEAMYYQVPVVTTSIGAEGMPEIERYTLIADQEEDFANKVLEIYSRKEEWTRYASASMEYIERHFSVKAGRAQLDKDISSIRV